MTDDSNISVCFLSKGSDAMRLVRRLDVALWIVNAALPDMSGFDLAHLLRRSQQGARVFLIDDEYQIENELRPFPWVCRSIFASPWIRPGFAAGRCRGSRRRRGPRRRARRRPASSRRRFRWPAAWSGFANARRDRLAPTKSRSSSPLFGSPTGARQPEEDHMKATAAKSEGRRPIAGFFANPSMFNFRRFAETVERTTIVRIPTLFCR